jgi:ABC-type phosphate transport system substrate-binding protein
MHSISSRPSVCLNLFGALALTLLVAGSAAADVVVIVNKSGPDSMTKEQVADVFLGKAATLPGGAGSAPHDLPESSALRDEFYSKVTGKSAAQAKSYWSKMAFTGKGTPPKEGSSGDVKKGVAAAPGGIGYVEKAEVDGSVKAVLTVN